MSEVTLAAEGLATRIDTTAGELRAVDGVDFELRKGECFALVGESGCGKSMTALSLLRLLPESGRIAGGRVLLKGHDLLALPEAAMRAVRGRRVAMIFQEPSTALNPVLTVGRQVLEVIERHLGLAGEEAKRRALTLLESVGIPDAARRFDEYPFQLSGGLKQRVMIAAALAADPEVLVADEPTTALDVTTQAQILELVRDLQVRRGMGVLFITHDFGVVADIAHRVAVLRLGTLVEMGDKNTVLKNPQHEYTIMLIGAVPTLKPHGRAVAADAPLVLETRQLAKTYSDGGWFSRRGDVHAANDVTLEIRRGQTLGIVGESGSGKSTVARCIVRLIDPTRGEILIHGEDIARKPLRALRDVRRKVQIVFQDPYRSLNPRRTVGDAIIEGPLNYGLPRPEALERARKLMELVRMDPAVLERYPHQFSGGQRQRICIARALAMEPELLVADEAVSALDVSVQAQVLALLEEIRERFNLAMLFITHDLRVAAQVCDWVAVMSKGKVVEYGEANEVFLRPTHEYTRALFAAAPGRDFVFGGR